MEKNNLVEFDEDIIADEFVFNDTNYAVLETKDSKELDGLLILMKIVSFDNEKRMLVNISDEEYKSASAYYFELLSAIGEDL